MSVNGGLQIAILLAALTANPGNHFELFLRQIPAAFYHPRFAKILTRFGVVGLKRQRALIIANPFIRTSELTGGIAAIVPGFGGITVFQRIQQVQCRLIFPFFAR